MRFFLCILLLLAVQHLSAQRECATYSYRQQQIQDNPVLANNLSRAEAFISQQLSYSTRTTAAAHTIITIPVVVHILYNTPEQNISDEQVWSQIEALNSDFRRKNGDTTNTPVYFESIAADVEIEFKLATADPKGRATTGIVRKKSSVSYWTMDDKIKFSAQGGDDAWDSRSYLNIWVGPMIKLLGFASAPGSPAEKDGVVVNTSAFGTINKQAPYNLGRTAVHEVGHWLGLKHIWGDAACGDDGVSDTPTQAGFTAGCPSGVRISCGNASTGDMYMNYMDFTNDACLNLFTAGQKERMRALFNEGGPRATLLQSKGLSAPWIAEAALPENEVTASINVYPNPAANELTVQMRMDKSWLGKQVRVVSLSGVMVQQFTITALAQQVRIKSLPAGVYFLTGENGDKRIRIKLIKL